MQVCQSVAASSARTDQLETRVQDGEQFSSVLSSRAATLEQTVVCLQSSAEKRDSELAAQAATNKDLKEDQKKVLASLRTIKKLPTSPVSRAIFW